jgi:hypothetical protein
MNLKHEYLEKNIKEKLFKKFESWQKEDFHFLLSLLNYPHYDSLGLIILTNLKNWILYGSGDFFYNVEMIDNILNKFEYNYDIYDDYLKEKENSIEKKNDKKENIKLNINKKEELEKKDQFIKLNNNCEFVFGDFLTTDIFSFGFWVILFILFLVFRSFQGKSLYDADTLYQNQNQFNIPFAMYKKENERENKSVNENKNENNFDFPLNKKELLNKVMDFFIGNKNMFFQ